MLYTPTNPVYIAAFLALINTGIVTAATAPPGTSVLPTGTVLPPTTPPPTTAPPPTTTAPQSTTTQTTTTESTTTLPTTTSVQCIDCSCVKQRGECLHRTAESCSSGYYPACSFPRLCKIKDCVCCVPTDEAGNKTCEARNGKCQNSADPAKMCNGYYETGLCPGDLNIQCCLKICGNACGC